MVDASGALNIITSSIDRTDTSAGNRYLYLINCSSSLNYINTSVTGGNGAGLLVKIFAPSQYTGRVIVCYRRNNKWFGATMIGNGISTHIIADSTVADELNFEFEPNTNTLLNAYSTSSGSSFVDVQRYFYYFGNGYTLQRVSPYPAIGNRQRSVLLTGQSGSPYVLCAQSTDAQTQSNVAYTAGVVLSLIDVSTGAAVMQDIYAGNLKKAVLQNNTLYIQECESDAAQNEYYLSTFKFI